MMRPRLAAALLLLPFSAFPAGVHTHAFMADRAIELVDRSEQPALKALLQANRNTVLAGAYFPDSGYYQALIPSSEDFADDCFRSFNPSAPAPTTPNCSNYGELAHWEHFLQGYIAYIRQTCPAPAEVPVRSHCATLIAHMMGVGAHGIGDEVWDFLFEEVVKDTDFGGSENAPGFANDVTTLDLLPTQLKDAAFGIPGIGAALADAHAGAQAIAGAIDDQARSIDPSANIEYNMDVALMEQFDRYAEMPLTDDLGSFDLPATGQLSAETVPSYVALPGLLDLDDRFAAIAAAFAQGNPQAAQAPVAQIPPFADLVTITNDYVCAGGGVANCGARAFNERDFIAGVYAGNAVASVEAVIAPYDSERVRTQLPWAYGNVYANSGGVFETAQVISRYFTSLWSRLDGRYTHPQIIGHHPANGETDVPYAPGEWKYRNPRSGNERGLIAAVLDHEIDWGSVRGGAFCLFDEQGQRIEGSYFSSYFWSANSDNPQDWQQNRGRRHFWFIPAQALRPATTYTAVISTSMKDYAGNPLARPYSWSFTTAEVSP